MTRLTPSEIEFLRAKSRAVAEAFQRRCAERPAPDREPKTD